MVRQPNGRGYLTVLLETNAVRIEEEHNISTIAFLRDGRVAYAVTTRGVQGLYVASLPSP